MTKAALTTLLTTATIAACGTDGRVAVPPLAIAAEPIRLQAISLLGDSLHIPTLDSATRAERETQLAGARAEYESAPGDPDALIWLGRRLAYLGRYREAIAVFTRGVAQFPDDARMLRHRGHRYITVRSLDSALADLLRATQLTANRPDEPEPDGLPNARGVPTSTLNSNIWYHLGLAHYLRGDFGRAASAYRECLRYSATPDMAVATSHWLYMSLRRQGAEAEASAVLDRITPDMDIVENQAYHALLLMYQGARTPTDLLEEARRGDALDNATFGYGIANWFLYSGDAARADSLFAEILAGSEWAAFGYLAAEADVARRR